MVLGLGAPHTAHATNYTYDGTDPHVTGCDANTSAEYTIGVALDGGYNGVGSLSLHYSNICSTAWAYFRCSGGLNGCYDYHIQVYRTIPDGKKLDGDYYSDLPVGSHIYTDQLNDAGSFRTKVCIWSLIGPFNEQCTNTF
jgi:hypothetical protein